jgi:hypothetical protein
MNKKYLIQWKSKVNGRAGKGTKLFDYEDGQSLVEELNLEYPQIQHELIEAPPPNAKPPEPPSTEQELAPETESEEANPNRQPVPVH